jgi:hypothetical protein
VRILCLLCVFVRMLSVCRTMRIVCIYICENFVLCLFVRICVYIKNKLHGPSPRANYTERATGIVRRCLLYLFMRICVSMHVYL